MHSKPHGFGATWGGENCSYHHNLFAHCSGRNPSIAGQERDRTCDGKPMQVNVVNNYCFIVGRG